MRIDTKGLGSILMLLAAARVGAQTTIYTYDNTTSGTIPETNSAQCNSGAGALNRTFTVGDSFTVSSIALGVNLTHADRGQVRVRLVAPDGSALNLIAGGTADADDNYDVLISTNSDSTVPPLDDNTADPVGEPYYARLVNNSATNFYTGNAAGTWTLRVCDLNAAGALGTFNRAHLVLTAAASASQVCTSTLTYNWADNGQNNPFTSAVVGDTTLSLASTRDLTGDQDSTTGGRVNFTTQTGTFGGQNSYFLHQFDDVDPQSPEQVLLESVWAFSPPVRDLSWRHYDMDWANAAWEDYVRVIGQDAGGGSVPYQLAAENASPSFQLAGDIVEADTGNVADTSNQGNARYIFSGAVTTVMTQYMEGDDWSNPQEQRIGIGNATWCAFDFGDAPNSYGTPLSNGPKHVLGNRRLWLGVNPPDGEADGQANATAVGDDDAMIGTTDDEDGFEGLSFPTCPNNGTYSVTMRVNNVSGSTGYLVGYMDWNRDGDFADPGERSATATVATGTSNGTQALSWSSVPANCGGTTQTYARFRFTTSQARAESPTDAAGTWAPDGEVEDYVVTAGTLPVTVARVESERDGDRLVVRWTTASEWANAGFRVWGRTGKGRWQVLAEVPSSEPDSLSPKSYETAVHGGEITSFTLEDASLFGERRFHGPYTVGESYGLEPEGMAIDWAAVRAETGMRGPRERVAARSGSGVRVQAAAARRERQGLLLVQEEGIQRVSYEELLAYGIDLGGTPASSVAVLDDGRGVPRYVASSNGAFGPGSYVEFYASPRLTLASPVDAFTITENRRQAIQVSSLPAVSGAAVGIAAIVDRYYQDKKYSFSSPNGDPWYDQGLLAWGQAASLTRTFDLPDLATGPVELTVKVWGYGGWPGSEPPDHHAVIILNGREVASGAFDDVVAWEPTVDVTGIVRPSGNVLEVRVPGDTGYEYDYVAFEGFEVSYRRTAWARGGSFSGSLAGDEPAALGGFADGEHVAIWVRNGGELRRGEQTAVAGQVGVPAGGEVWAATAAATRKPVLRAGVPAPQESSSAEYVIVTHPVLVGAALTPLVALEKSKGFSTEVVTVDAIYAAYSDHAASAEAIKKFFAASLAQGKMKYALIVGADTTDPYDHLRRGSLPFVPSEYVPYVEYVSFSPTDETLVDADGDGVGDVPIGRLPVRTATELANIVAKLERWHANAAGAARRAFLVAGKSDEDSDLKALNLAYAGSLDTWSTSVAAVDEASAGVVHNWLLAALDSGTPLISFVGHSSMGQWDSPSIFRWQDVSSLSNFANPSLVVQWGCWNSYYADPTIESLSARLLRTPGPGAAATIGATTLTTDAAHQALGTAFFRQLNRGARTVGEAFRGAKQELRAQGEGRDAILGMTLLGDPAMPLPR